MNIHWTDHLLFLLLGVWLPWRSISAGPSPLEGVRFDTRTKLALYWGNNAWLWLLTLLVAGVWYGNGRSWALLGMAPMQTAERGWPYLALGLFVALYVADTIADIRDQVRRADTRATLRESMGFLPENGREFLHFIPVALTAGFCEEVIFRGYMLRYLQAVLAGLDGSYTLALLGAGAVFGSVHLYQGWRAVVKIMSMAVLFGYVFVHTGSIWLLAGLHFLIDLAGGGLAWQLLRRAKDDH